jgi:hypothetical protein
MASAVVDLTPCPQLALRVGLIVEVVPLARFEHATSRLVGGCSSSLGLESTFDGRSSFTLFSAELQGHRQNEAPRPDPMTLEKASDRAFLLWPTLSVRR